MLTRLLLAFALCTVAGQLWADMVWLDNGARLSGEIVLLDGGKLSLKTRHAGRVLIDWKHVATLSSEKPRLVRRQGLDSERSPRLVAAEIGTVLVEGEHDQVLPLVDITRLVPPRRHLEDRVWEGNRDAKLDIERNENDVDEWKLKGNMRMEHGRWRRVASGDFEHEKKTASRSQITGNWSTTSTASSPTIGSGERG